MDEIIGLLLKLDKEKFSEKIAELLSSMGYQIRETSIISDKEVEITAESKDPLTRGGILLKVFKGKRKVTLPELKKSQKRMGKCGAVSFVYVTTSGFAKTCTDYALKNHVTLIDGDMLSDMSKRNKLSFSDAYGGPHNIYDLAFDLGVTLNDAKGYFEKKRSKLLFKLFGSEEKIDSIDGRYAPIGSFDLYRTDEMNVGSIIKTTRTVDYSNKFYVNLNTGELYYLEYDVLAKKLHLMVSPVLVHMMRLPHESIDLLAEIVRYGGVPFSKLNSEHMLLVGDHMQYLMGLESQGLIRIGNDMHMTCMSDIPIPAFNKSRYDLTEYLERKRSVESELNPDEVNLHPDDVLGLLMSLFSASGDFNEVVYMPYYNCKYDDDKGLFRYERILAPKFSREGV